ncbi:hypothetical protein SDC9_164745 [bioreactor metagenome]|uniref:Uncharacterized protein n=1 Tax=bioreactor metagenome TaxID=1076179 RepID=A0A645FUR3_9ZZZZ
MVAPVGAKIVDKARDAGRYGSLGLLTVEVGRAVGGAVIAHVLGENFVPAGIDVGQADGVLVGVRAAQGEHDLAHLRNQLGDDFLTQHAPGGGGVGRGHIAKLRRLSLNGSHDLFILEADVYVDQLGGGVEILRVVIVPEIAALCALDGNVLHGVLCRPGVKIILLGQVQNVLLSGGSLN